MTDAANEVEITEKSAIQLEQSEIVLVEDAL